MQIVWKSGRTERVESEYLQAIGTNTKRISEAPELTFFQSYV